MSRHIFWGVEKILPLSTPFFGIILHSLPTSKKHKILVKILQYLRNNAKK